MNIKKATFFLIYFKTNIVRRYIGGKGGTFEYITREYTLGSYLADVVSKLNFIKVFLDVGRVWRCGGVLRKIVKMTFSV